MLQKGLTFNKNGNLFCLIDFVYLNNNKYALFSIETDKLNYSFYLINENDAGVNLTKVNDENLEFNLYEKMEESA